MAYTPHILSFVTVFNEFNPHVLHRDLPEIKKVIYYIHAWQFHDPPDPKNADWASCDLICEVRELPRIPYDTHVASVSNEIYTVPTLIVIQKKLKDLIK